MRLTVADIERLNKEVENAEKRALGLDCDYDYEHEDNPLEDYFMDLFHEAMMESLHSNWGDRD